VLTNVKLLGDAAHRRTVVNGHVFRICNTASYNYKTTSGQNNTPGVNGVMPLSSGSNVMDEQQRRMLEFFT